MTALLIFPCLALLWLVISEKLGWVRDQPLRTRERSADLLGSDTSTGRRRVSGYEPVVAMAGHGGNGAPRRTGRR